MNILSTSKCCPQFLVGVTAHALYKYKDGTNVDEGFTCCSDNKR